MEEITVLVACTEPLLVSGLATTIGKDRGLTLVAETSDRKSTVPLIGKFKPRAAIVDIDCLTPQVSETFDQIRRVSKKTAVIVLLRETWSSQLSRCIEAGAEGYLSTRVNPQEVIETIYGVCAGETVVKLRYSRETIQRFRQRLSAEGDRKDQPAGQRELQVLKLAAKGLSNKRIAETLYISQRTVQSHLSAIFDKLGTTSRIQAILKAREKGWLADEDLISEE